MNGPERLPLRAMLLAELLAAPVVPAAAGDPNRPLFAALIAGQSAGWGCLPTHLGLGPAAFARLRARCFPGVRIARTPRPVIDIPERDDLRRLLLDHRAGLHESECLVADIVATACGGSDHLWQDLGLANRDELSALMRTNFPALAEANSSDMKWKKFLYRQFCARDGIYVCPAPSCGVCTDFAKCFGPES